MRSRARPLERDQTTARERALPLDPVVQLMYLARCNAQLGEKTAAENNCSARWNRPAAMSVN